MYRGVTLIELLIVLVVLAVLAGIVAPSLVSFQDRLAVGQARNELLAFYRSARLSAVWRGARVRLEFGADTLRVVQESTDSVLLVRPGPARRGVAMTTSRATLRIQPTGVGYGAANTTIVLSRGGAVDSLATSRLGRIRRIT